MKRKATYKINIAEEVEKTLNSLERFPKVELDPFFITRLEARIEQNEQRTILNWFFETPYLKPVLLSIFLVINVLTLVDVFYHSSTKTAQPDSIQAFVSDYELNSNVNSYLVFNEE